MELVGNNELKEALASLEVIIETPTANATTYEFPVGSFFGMLSAFVTDSEDGHVFSITVEDNNGKKANSSLSVIVNAANEGGTEE